MKHIYPNYKVVLLCSNQCGQATALVASIFLYIRGSMMKIKKKFI